MHRQVHIEGEMGGVCAFLSKGEETPYIRNQGKSRSFTNKTPPLVTDLFFLERESRNLETETQGNVKMVAL